MSKFKVTSEHTTDGKMFAVHASECADLAKRTVIADAQSVSEAAQAIANVYGGYSDNGDAPRDEKHALSWATVKSCTRKAAR
jgi:hypothetical protein